MSIEILADIEEFFTGLKAKYTPEIKTVENEAHAVAKVVEVDALAIEQKIVAIGYPLIMQDALTLVTGALTGSPWAALVGTLIKTAENQGHTLVATAADAALNLAKAQLVVSGTVAPTVPATV